jgi:L-rhamnose isomerase
MGAGEAVAFVDAVHPTHQVRPAGCWARKDVVVAVEQTTGRERLNIHGAINLETGQTQIVAVDKVNAQSFIKLLGEIDFNSLNSVAAFNNSMFPHEVSGGI